MHPSIRRIRLVVEATRDIRLHPHAAAQIYALLGEACGEGGTRRFPDGGVVLAPERGRIVVQKGERYAFGLALVQVEDARAAETCARLARGLRERGKKGTGALGGNFELVEVLDLVGGAPLAPSSAPAEIPIDRFERETERVAAARELRLRIHTPFRKPRWKRDRLPGSRFYDRRGLPADAWLQAVTGRLQGLGLDPGELDAECGAVVVQHALTWLDLKYGPPRRRRALGGVVGELVLRLDDPRLARALVWAQYLGVGQNTRFGHGQFRIDAAGIDRTACARSEPLLDLAVRRGLESGEAARAAESEGLPTGALRAGARRLLDPEWAPLPPRSVELRSASGRTRELRVPAPLDRALQRLILATVGPGLDAWFEESSFAHRRGLSTRAAAGAVQRAYDEGFHHVLRADFERFYDRVDLDLLGQRLAATLDDPDLERVLLQWVGGGDGRAGLPTGAPLSPVLGNLVLDRFDEEVEELGARLVRYADDFVLLARSEEALDRIEDAARAMARDLELALNERKTERFAPGETFEFLGFRFTPRPASAEGDAAVVSTRPNPGALSRLGYRKVPATDTPMQPRTPLPGESGEVSFGEGRIVVIGPERAIVKVEGPNLVARTEVADERRTWPLALLEQLIVVGRPTISSRAWSALADRGTDVLLLREHGRRLVRLGTEATDLPADLVRAHVVALEHAPRRLGLVQQLVAAKIHNHAALAAAFEPDGEGAPVVGRLRDLAVRVRSESALDRLLGHEGHAASAWYAALRRRLPKGLTFSARHGRGATDPVNALMNLGHTLVHRWTAVALRGEGLVPTIGLLHRARAGHAALASDLQEPLRHVVDRAVVELVEEYTPGALGYFDEESGRYELRGTVVRALVLRLGWHVRMEVGAAGDEGKEPLPARSYLGWMLAQVRSLRAHLLDSNRRFHPFRHP